MRKITIKEKAIQEKKSRKGKTARNKGGSYERAIAKKFSDRYQVELKRTPQSGGFAKRSEKADDFRGDITIVDNKLELTLHLELKNQKTLKMWQWLNQAEEDCPEGRTPCLIFHKHQTNQDYITLPLESFFELVERNKVIRKRRFT